MSQSAAAKYADQHNITNQPQYFVAFPEADGVVSELMIAGYQKMLEGDTFGLTNSTQQVKELMTIYGNEGLHLDAHSRGSMTVGNALRSFAADPASYGMLSNTVITFFGPAFNAQEADGLLALLQSRQNKDPATQASYDLKMQNHFNDIVGVFSGGNPSTGGFVPVGSSLVLEKLKVLFGDITVHNCYGNGGPDCGVYWNLEKGSENIISINSLLKAKEKNEK